MHLRLGKKLKYGLPPSYQKDHILNCGLFDLRSSFKFSRHNAYPQVFVKNKQTNPLGLKRTQTTQMFNKQTCSCEVGSASYQVNTVDTVLSDLAVMFGQVC